MNVGSAVGKWRGAAVRSSGIRVRIFCEKAHAHAYLAKREGVCVCLDRALGTFTGERASLQRETTLEGHSHSR